MAIVSKRVNGLIPGKEYLLGVKIKNSSIGLSSDMSDVIRFQVPTDQTIPGTVQNFALYQGIESVMFVFDFTSDDDISTHEYELYDSNNLNTGNKISSGFNDANVFTVSVDNLQEDNEGTGLVPYWGRVRAVDTSGNVGEWTNLVQTDSRTPLIDNQFIGSLTAAKITAGTIGAHEIILTQSGTPTTITSPSNKAVLRSSDYNGSYNNLTDVWSAGTRGWIISGDGRAEFNDATIRGTLQFVDGSSPGLVFYGGTQPSIPVAYTSKLISAISGSGTEVTYTTSTAHGLSVGNIVSFNNVNPIEYNLKNQYVSTIVNTTTFKIKSSATGVFDPIYSIGAEVVAGSIPEFSIWYNSTSGDNKSYIYSSSTWNQSLANVSNLNPQNQTQTGLIAGTTITGGGITLSAGGNIKGGQTAYDTGTGFFLGYSSSAYRFSIGNSSGNKLTWDGSTLAVTGAISGSTITGSTITGGSLSTTDSKLVLGVNSFNNGIASGSKSSIKIMNSATASDTASITEGIYFQDASNNAIFSKITGNSWLGEYYLNIHSPRTSSGNTLDYSHILLGSDGINQDFKDINSNKWSRIQLGSGNILIGTSNSAYSLSHQISVYPSYISIYPTTYTSFMNESNSTSAGYLRIPCDSSNTAITTFAKTTTSYHITFHNTSNAVIGTIRTDNVYTYYDNYSDYRLKENISTIDNASSIIKSLKPVYFNYKNYSDQTVMGFIAHEVQEIFPYLVSASKDAVNEDGSPMYQTLDYSKFTPILTAALKEVIKRLEVLENK